MGTQSNTHPPRPTHAPLRIALLLLLSFASSLTATAQTASVSALTVPLILPSAIVFDTAGNLYIAETGNHVIRKVDLTGNITTIAGTGTQGFSGDAGPATSATLDSPQGLALDTKNNLYIADTHNHRIRKLNLTTGIITTIAGTTTPGFSGDTALATAAQLNLPTALALDPANNLYLADTGNHRIRKITATTGIITTIAGTGTQGFSGDRGSATSAAIDSPTGLALDTDNNLYLADTHNHRIRKIAATTGIITTIAGTGTQGFSGDTTASTTATLALPHGITIDPAGNLYLADTHNHRIRRIDATTGIITTVAGDGTQAFAGDGGPAIAASLDTPRAAAVSPSTLLTLADTGNQRIRQLDAAPAPATTIHTIAGLGLTTPGALTLTAPSVIAYGTGQLTATLASTTTRHRHHHLPRHNYATNTTTSAPPPSPPTSPLCPPPPCPPANTTSPPPTPATRPTPPRKAPPSPSPSRRANSTRPSLPPLSSTAKPSPASPALSSASFRRTPPTSPPPSPPPPLRSLPPEPIPSPQHSPAPQQGTTPYASPVATLTINPATTLITLSNLIATATPGSSITLTAHVASTTTGTPTGSVTLLDGSAALFTTPLSITGDAVFTITSITQGPHSFTALYAGSTNFSPSVSAPQLITGGTGSPTHLRLRSHCHRHHDSNHPLRQLRRLHLHRPASRKHVQSHHPRRHRAPEPRQKHPSTHPSSLPAPPQTPSP